MSGLLSTREQFELMAPNRVDLGRYLAFVPERTTPADPCPNCLALWWSDRRRAANEPDTVTPPTLLHRMERRLERISDERPSPGTQRVNLLDRLTGEVTKHTLAPHPGCAECGATVTASPSDIGAALNDADQLDGESWRLRPLDAQALRGALLEPTWGPLLGVIREDTSEACLTRVPVNLPSQGSFVAGYGRGSTFTGSEGPALVEALERLVSAAPIEPATRVLHASFREIRDEAFDPRRLGSHNPRHVGHSRSILTPFSEDVATSWVTSWSTLEERGLYVPAHVAYWRVHDNLPKFAYSSSSGTATGGSMAEAVLYGLFELIERDAFLLMWHGRVALPQVRWEHIPRAAELASRLERNGMRLRVLDATTEFGVAVSVAVIEASPDTVGLGRNRALNVAAGAHFDQDIATLSAIDEAANNALMYGRWSTETPAHFEPDRFLPMLDDFSLVEVLEDHEGVFGLNEARPHWSFLTAGFSHPPRMPRKPKASRTLGVALHDLMTEFHRRKMDVIVIDQSQLRSQPGQLRTVRVVVPELLAMTFGHVHSRLHNSQRLNAAHRSLVAALNGASPPVNPVPHPFP
ncbi:MAG: YcaO-like family protein [Leifsonia sp.]